MNIVDDTKQQIYTTLQNDTFSKFARTCQELKLVHRCLDGMGINYDKNKATSIKGYCKILDSFPKFSDEFYNFFLGDLNFRLQFENLCRKQANSILSREDGLSGINLSIKFDLQTQEITKAAYVKISKGKSCCITLSQDKVFQRSYRYIFNPLLKFMILKYMQLKIPVKNHALEFSRKKFCTVYPMLDPKPGENPTGLSKKYDNFFKELNNYNPWEIEKFTEDLDDLFGRKITPITKGFERKDVSRKFYFGAFSYKYSLFDHFSECPNPKPFKI
jgi:hypothetical protein